MSVLSAAQPKGVTVRIHGDGDQALPTPVLDLSALLSADWPCTFESGTGRGIVIPGGGIYLRSAWVTVRMIRQFGCTLPIELWLLPWEEVSQTEEFALRLQGVTIRRADDGYCLDEEITGYAGLPCWLAGWQLKVQAVCQSAFREVIYFDADCYPVDGRWEKSLTAAGNTFLGDIAESDHLLSAESCQAMGVERRTPVDSGCFYIAKDEAWCRLAAVLNGPEFVRDTYRRFFGDKDTWRIACDLADVPYRILGRGAIIGEHEGIYHAVGVVHRTGHKLTTGDPRNTPQKASFCGPAEDLVQAKLRSWPPLAMRNERDWEIVASVLELDEYRLSSMGPLQTVVDCGGHIGSFSAAVLRRWPECQVITIEPSEKNAEMIRQNAPGAMLVVTAIGDGTGTVVLTSAFEGDTVFHTERASEVASNAQTARLSRLSAIIEDTTHVDLLKMDIEGDEYDVFTDLVIYNQMHKISRIVGEWHYFTKVAKLLELLRPTHHITICVHQWDNGYFEAVKAAN